MPTPTPIQAEPAPLRPLDASDSVDTLESGGSLFPDEDDPSFVAPPVALGFGGATFAVGLAGLLILVGWLVG